MSTAKKQMPAGAALSSYDTAEFLRTPQEVADYLEAVFEEYGGDSRVVVAALGDAAKAFGMQKIAKEAGLNREALYKALSGKANPSFDTVLKVMSAVGVELKPVARDRKVGTGPKASKAGSYRLRRSSNDGRLSTAATRRKAASHKSAG